MPNTAVSGVEPWGGRTRAIVVDHTGPTSYTTGGELLSQSSTLGGSNVFGLASFNLIDTAVSFSGNYRVDCLYGGLGPRSAVRLRWSAINNAVLTDAGMPLGLGTLSAASTNTVVTAGHVGTVTVANTLKAGQFVYLSLFTQMGALNGTIVKVTAATPTTFSFNLGSAAAVSTGADTTGKFQVVQAGPNNLLQLAPTSAAITNSLATTSLLTMTCANTFAPGNFVYIDGLTNGAVANGVIVQVSTSSATQFTAVWTGSVISTAADAGTATLLITNGTAPIMADYATNVSNSLSTASSAGTQGVISLTATNALYPGNIVVPKGLTAGAGFNGDILVANASTTGILLVSNHQTAAVSTTADVGSLSLVMTGAPTDNGEVPAGFNLSGETVRLVVLGG